MEDLRVTVFQYDISWEDPAKNRAFLHERISALEGGTDLVVLPEVFTTGFTRNARSCAEDMEGETVAWLRGCARDGGFDITGSIIVRDNGRFYNRLIWAKPDGGLLTYDKHHLFRITGEHKTYSAGQEILLVELKGWKLAPFICYDLRFPVWIRNIQNRYDAAIFVANWPALRSAHWRLLLTARAVENQAYVIGVNRVGTDGNGHAYAGESSIIDPRGDVVFQGQDEVCIHTEQLSHSLLHEYRETFPVWMDADFDLIKPFS